MASMQQPMPAKDSNGLVSEEVRRAMEQQRTQKERQKQALGLQKENILSQRTSNPARRSALESALAHIEAQIAKFD